MRYRKKPVVIDAVSCRSLIYNAEHHWDLLPVWVKEEYEKGNMLITNFGVRISTLEGPMEGGYKDWIIKGIKGELYPCRDDIFRETYERVYDD